MARWQIFGAVALRRLPVISPQLDAIEQKVHSIFSEYEDAYSKLSAHEALKIKESKVDDETKAEILIHETAQDREDTWNKRLASFSIGPHNERLTKVEYLFAKQKFGTDIKDQWLLPQAQYNKEQDKSLLDTCKRALNEHLSIVDGYKIVNKIPSSVYSFIYPKKIQDLTEHTGAKVFFLKAYLDSPSQAVIGLIDPEKNSKVQWFTGEEAKDNVHQKYMLGLWSGMFHEKRVNTEKVLRYAEAVCRNK